MGEGQPRILIVDDQPDVAEMFLLYLRHAGYSATVALSAKDALRLAQAEQFDLILADIAMPQMNGYELAEALRSMPDYRSVPLVAVTGFSAFDDRERSLKAGFNAHLSKPVYPPTLLGVIQRLWSNR